MDDFLRQISDLKIKPRKKLTYGETGNYRSQSLGNSMDFYDHRQYIPQDDVRRIDWKAYMRTKNLYIRQFTEEKTIHIKVIMDNSLSMDYGTSVKFDLAKTLTKGIGYLTLNQGDIFSFIPLNNGTYGETSIKGKDKFYQLLKVLDSISCEGMTDYENIIRLNEFNRERGGITFLITDGFGENIDKVLDFLCGRGEEVLFIQILSEDEVEPEVNDKLKLIDKETNKIVKIDINRIMKDMYKKKINSFIDNNRNMSLKRDIVYTFALSSDSPQEILRKTIGGM